MGRTGLAVKEFRTLLLYILLGAVTVLALAPTAWMFSTSLKARGAVFEQTIRWIPNPITLENYSRAFSSLPLLTWLNNSALIAAFTLILTLLCDILIAFAFARLEFRGKNLLFMLVLTTIMVPSQATAVPMFKLINWMGLIDTKTGIVVPQAAEAIGVFLLTQFFKGIPKELGEAARIDGCSNWQILWKIIVPLSGPAITVLTILTLANSWNNFLWPLIVAQSEASITLPVGLASLMSGFSEAAEAREYGLLMATSMVACLPTIVAFLVLQQRFIEGITMTGLKG
ncbi:MAG: carbohydrate ABC transporter permease [Firmicutes bacterium]|nr:carbohydrate ABC transporter permease [Bacillota bacterium]